MIKNETDLIETIKSIDAYKSFLHCLPNKTQREKEAWDLIVKNRNHYSEITLNSIFDKVDIDDSNKRWFGQLLAKPNRNWIFETPINELNKWIEDLLFTDKSIIERFNGCMKEKKIRGASKGLLTLLLYLSDSERYNIWVNKTQEGLYILNRIPNFNGKDFGNYYHDVFNPAALEFRKKYDLKPQEIDWILTFIAGYVENNDDGFIMDEDSLKTQEIDLVIDDESELDDLVGQPMELKVMRWAPTNEMGVVALFIEFRKELGFPFIEIIRTRFPDAVVFEKSSRGHIRKYVEFEFKSSGYKSHLKSSRVCHYVVCWEHNWKECPIQVIELQKEIPKILNKK